MDTDRTSAPASQIVVRDFRLILLWPMRIDACGSLRDSRSPDKGACHWLSTYARSVASSRPWTEIPDYYRSAGRSNEPPEEQRYSEFLYFHPFIQKCFYGKQNYPVSILKRTDIQAARITLKKDQKPWICKVERINLFLFPTDVAIVAIQLDNPVSEDPETLFHLSDALDFVDWVRRIYPPYFAKDDGQLCAGGTPHSVEWLGPDCKTRIGDASNFQCANAFLKVVRENRVAPVADHWRSLLEPLLPQGAPTARDCLAYAQVEDDRLPVCASIGVDDPMLISEPDWIRLAFCDSSDDSYKWPYSSKFLENFERDNCYDRFWERDDDPKKRKTTRYLITGYSFLVVGRHGEPFFDNLIRQHAQQHYFILCLLAHLQKASLLSFWKRLAEMQHKFENEKATRTSKAALFEAQQWLLQDLTDFVSRFYFQEVSNQLQAIELFDLITDKLRIKNLFQDVVEQSEFVGKVMFEDWQKRSTDQQAELAQLANRWLPAAFTAAFLGLSLGVPMIQDQVDKWLGGKGQFSWTKLGIGVAFALISFLVVWGVVAQISRRFVNRARKAAKA